MALVTVKNKYQVVIPQALRKQVGVNIGDLLEAKAEKGKIIFIRKTVIDSRIAESLVEYKAGKFYGPFSKHRDFIASLHREAKKLKQKK